MAVKVGSFAKSTSTSVPVTQAISGVGFQPKALILWTVGATSANAYAGHIRQAFGISDGTTSGSIASALDDATANTNAGRNTAAKALCIVDGDGGIEAECSVTFDVDGFTLSWSTNNATAYIINYMALGGADLTHAKVLQWQTGTSTGDQAISGVGFQPDAMIGIIGKNAALGTGTTGANSTITFATAAKVWSAGWSCANNASTGIAYSDVFNTAIQDGGDSSDYQASLKSIDADGWTYNWSNAPSDTFYAFQLCLKGGSYKTNLTTKSTGSAPATQTINGLGFTPEGVLLVMNHTSGNYGLCMVVGAGDGTDERCGLVTDEYNAATIEAKHYNGDAKVLVQDYSRGLTAPNQVTDSECDLSSLAAGEFSLNWTTNQTAAACELGWFAFAGGEAETGETLDLAASGASTSAGSARMSVFGAIFAGASVSAGALRMRIGRHFAASGASTSAGTLRTTVYGAGWALVTQAGLLVDADSTPPIQVTQAGALLDAIRTPPINVTQAGALLDAIRTPPVKVTQAGLIVDVDSTPPIKVTQAGLMIDARYQRPESTLNCWEFWIEDVVGHHLAYLDGATNKAYLEALSDCGSGMFTLSAHDPKATAANLAVGNIVKVRYRNVDIGAWMIENIQEALVGPRESAEQAYVVSGRGLMALLEHGLVYPADLTDTSTAEREFDGVSKAQILLDLYAEFVARGGGELNMAFSSEMDSSGQAFTDTVILNFKAGQNLFDVAHNLAGLGLELTVDPDKTLQAWNTAGVDRSATICFRHGQSVMSSQRTTEGIGLTNAVLGEGQGVFVESVDATSIASHRRRECYLPVRNTEDAGQVGVANTLLLAGWKEPRSAYTLEVLAEPFYPCFDYRLGDVVAISIPDELEGDYRILGISIKEIGGPCDLRVALEIKDLATETLQKHQLAFNASLMSVRPGPAATSGLGNSGTEPLVGASGTNLQPGAIKSPQVAWGTGTDQVSSAVVPIADAGSHFTGTNVETALQELGTAVGTIVTDHGGLSGRADDDHAQYLLATGARDGATSGTQQFTGGVSTGDAFYLGSPTADGSWRIVKSGNNLAFERRETGSWVEKGVVAA